MGADSTLAMNEAKRAFVRAALQCGALRLGGPFRLKSGKQSPYFFDTSRFTGGAELWALSEVYVRTLLDSHGPPDLLFGPAYKGIPLAVACAMQLQRLGHPVGYLFDRKEAKLHGENSAEAGDARELARKRLVGRLPEGRESIVLLDDVLTTGGTKLEALELLALAAPEAKVVALVLALDRQEAGPAGLTAAQEFTQKTGIPVFAALTATELLEVLRQEGLATAEQLDAIQRYLEAR